MKYLDYQHMSRRVENKRAPELRFPEFQNSGDWVYANGDVVFDQIADKDHNSDLPILAITQEHGAIPREQIDYSVTVTDKSVESYKVVEVGDFIISLRSFQGGIEYSNYKGICSPAYIILRKKKDVLNTFFKQYFKTKAFITSLNKNIEGIRDGKMVSYKQFSELLLPLPSPVEQQKIADCLSSLDDLITAETQKLDLLKAHKKGLMQQLFPAEGETEPKLRFKEFKDSGEWESYPLSKFINSLDAGVSVNSGDRPATEKELGILKTSCVTNSVFEPKENKVVVDELEIERLREPVSGNTIIISRMNTPALVGANAYIGIDINNIFLPDRLWAAKPKSNANMRFIAQILGSVEGRKALAELATGTSGSMKNISKTDVFEMQILAPKNQEQQKIASCLSSLDELITALTEKTDTLKLHKKGLMQQLFPNINESNA